MPSDKAMKAASKWLLDITDVVMEHGVKWDAQELLATLLDQFAAEAVAEHEKKQTTFLTDIQQKKIQYLMDKDGKCEAPSYSVWMPDGTIATVDPFGRTTWSTEQEKENDG